MYFGYIILYALNVLEIFFLEWFAVDISSMQFFGCLPEMLCYNDMQKFLSTEPIFSGIYICLI